MKNSAHRCARCGKELTLEGKVSREALCPHCGAYLHACLNCSFYSPGSHNDCREPQAEYVRDKRSANFCDYFQYKNAGQAGEVPASDKKHDARGRFDKLFGG